METVIDTLKIYERLRAADLSDKAAKEIAEVIKDNITDELVTKQFLDLKLKEFESRVDARFDRL